MTKAPSTVRPTEVARRDVLPNGLRRWEFDDLQRFTNTREPAFLRSIEEEGSDQAKQCAALARQQLRGAA